MSRIQPPAGWSLDPVREEQVREWAAKLGASTSADSIGPYSALYDALAEIDRLRAELAELRLTPRERANRRVRGLIDAGDHEAACAAAEAFEASEAYDVTHPRV